MAKRFEFVEVPYIGIVPATDEDFGFGFRELLQPDSEVVFYSGSREEKALDRIESSIYSRKEKIRTRWPIFWSFATFPLGTPYFAAKAWRHEGRKRAYNRAMEYIEENGFSCVEEIDLGAFYNTGKEEGLEEKLDKYGKMGDSRKGSLGGGVKGFFEKKLSKHEDEGMKDYRLNAIYPIFRSLEEKARKKWEKAGEEPYRHIFETYRKFNKWAGSEDRLRGDIFSFRGRKKRLNVS